jgi:hypothetical protein
MGIVDEFTNEFASVIYGFITWFVVQLLLDAFFPPVALVINFGFVLFTVYGLLQDLDDTMKAASLVGFLIGLMSLLLSLWLTVIVH